MRIPFLACPILAACLFIPNVLAGDGGNASEKAITDYLISAPIGETSTSVTMGAAIGSSAGSVHTYISGDDSAYENSYGLSGAIGEINVGYALALPHQLYGAIGAFVDTRSNSAELETGLKTTSYNYRQKSVFGLTLSAGWVFARGDILYGKIGHSESNLERSGSESASTGANFHRVYRDAGMQQGFGFLMAASPNTYWRYEFATTPAFSEFSNTYGDSTFKYKTTTSEFKVGWEYYLSPFRSHNDHDFHPLQIDGVYFGLLFSEDNLMLDHKYQVDLTTSNNILVEKYIRPSLNLMGGYSIGYGSSLATSNIYAAIEYSIRHHISENETHNRIHNDQENFAYRLHEVKVSSLVFGFRPHPSDLFFGRLGYTTNKLQQIDPTASSDVNLTLEGRGTLLGFGFETSLYSMLSISGEYDYSDYGDPTSGSLVLSPVSHMFTLAVILRP